MLPRRTYRFLVLGVIAVLIFAGLQSWLLPRGSDRFSFSFTSYGLSRDLGGEDTDRAAHVDVEVGDDIFQVPQPSLPATPPPPPPPSPPPPVDETKNCDRCLVSPEWCAEFGSRNLDLTMAHEGTGDRLRRVLDKFESGQPVKFGIIGGSLSRGHGCHCTPFHKQIFDWFNETYPHPDNLYIDGSVGARGSNYFKFCHAEHLRPDLDIVIVELSINDNFNIENVRNMESIIRSMLSYQSQPAVIMTASFSLMNQIEMGIDGHMAVAQYYDVPVISMRNALLPIIHKYPEMRKTYFAWENPIKPDLPDILHLSGLGHAALAKTTIALIQRQQCILRNGRPTEPGNSTIWPAGEDFTSTVPWQRLMDNYNADQKTMSPIDRPQCMSIDSPRQKLTPISSEGWEPWKLPYSDEKIYLRATEPGKRISFDVMLHSGQVAIYYLKSRTMGLGFAKCWIDNDEEEATWLDAWWPLDMNIGEFRVIHEGKTIPPGKHIVTCETIPQGMKDEGRGNTFLLIAVMTV